MSVTCRIGSAKCRLVGVGRGLVCLILMTRVSAKARSPEPMPLEKPWAPHARFSQPVHPVLGRIRILSLSSKTVDSALYPRRISSSRRFPYGCGGGANALECRRRSRPYPGLHSIAAALRADTVNQAGESVIFTARCSEESKLARAQSACWRIMERLAFDVLGSAHTPGLKRTVAPTCRCASRTSPTQAAVKPNGKDVLKYDQFAPETPTSFWPSL